MKALDFNAFGNAVSLDEISLMSPTMVTADYYPRTARNSKDKSSPKPCRNIQAEQSLEAIR
ncbi:hypothetical protein NXW84_09800 [Bacteroides fragilis]|nr:hypothetical protein NXW84_09800 [Bacteroides fragilis]